MTIDQLSGHAFTAAGGTRDDQPFTAVQGSALSISFTGNQMAASAGCNQMSGTVSLVDGALVVDGGLAQTEMACTSPLMKQEDWYARFLTSGPAITLDGSALTLANATDSVQYGEEQPAADVPLVGTTWKLDGIVTGSTATGAVSSIPRGVHATVVFDASGRVGVDAGCNSIGGDYSADPSSITVTGLSMTLMACLGPRGSVEKSMLDVVHDGSIDYVIDGGTLTLSRGGAGLVLKAAAQ
ncbi:MAG: META domain-containing protein [Actinomycetes bacterium]